MKKFRIATILSAVALAAVSLMAPRPAQAAVYLTLARSPTPISDLDGIVGLADISTTSATLLTLEARYSSIGGLNLSGGGVASDVLWGMTIGMLDGVETSFGSMSIGTPGPNVTLGLSISDG